MIMVMLSYEVSFLRFVSLWFVVLFPIDMMYVVTDYMLGYGIRTLVD